MAVYQAADSSMKNGTTLALTIDGHTLCCSTDLPQVEQYWRDERKLGRVVPGIIGIHESDVTPDLSICSSVETTFATDNVTLTLRTPTSGLFLADAAYLLLPLLARRLTPTRSFLVHAAAVAKDDACVLIAGASGCGKTLTALLAARRIGAVLSSNRAIVRVDDEVTVTSGTHEVVIRERAITRWLPELHHELPVTPPWNHTVPVSAEEMEKLKISVTTNPATVRAVVAVVCADDIVQPTCVRVDATRAVSYYRLMLSQYSEGLGCGAVTASAGVRVEAGMQQHAVAGADRLASTVPLYFIVATANDAAKFVEELLSGAVSIPIGAVQQVVVRLGPESTVLPNPLAAFLQVAADGTEPDVIAAIGVAKAIHLWVPYDAQSERTDLEGADALLRPAGVASFVLRSILPPTEAVDVPAVFCAVRDAIRRGARFHDNRGRWDA